jgi:hypothetical protein
MHTCSFQESCRFFQQHQKPKAGNQLTRQLYAHYCAGGRIEECALRSHFETNGGKPPRTLLPNGGCFIDTAEIYLLALVALIFSLIAGLLTAYFAYW